MSELENRVPEIRSLGPFEVEENRTAAGQLEAVDWDEEDEVIGYGIAGGADGGLFTVEAGKLRFREAPDYENPGDIESTDPQSAAGDNEYVVVVWVRSGQGERERTGEQAIRVRVTDEEEEEAGEDLSDFTEGDLAGRRLSLEEAGSEGIARSLRVRFLEDNRFEHFELIPPDGRTKAGPTVASSGTYAYQRTGFGVGRLRLDYDDGSFCEIQLTFSVRNMGRFSHECSQGSRSEGSFHLTTGSLFVPVILAATGRSNSFFTSELALTNRGQRGVRLNYIYTAHRGGGSGTASEVLEAGRQKIEADALGYLRRLGIPIPDSGDRIGTLRVEMPSGSEAGVLVRTTAAGDEERAGLAYPGVPEEEGFEEAVYLCGLRQNHQDRSNVAVQNAGEESQGYITVRVTIFSGDPASADRSLILSDLSLPPGGFYQYNGILNEAGIENGYVKVERVEGAAPFYAYGVINDQVNSDGSFVFPVKASSLEGTVGQTLPVIVETGDFSSELTVTNFSAVAKRVDFRFVAEAVGSDDDTARFSLELEAGEQRIFPGIIDWLRRQEVEGIGPANRAFAGAAFATVAEEDMSGIVIGARTGAPDHGSGQYSLFYHAVPYGLASVDSAWIYGLQQNEENRSNLALVNTGEIDDSPSTFEIVIYQGDGDTQPRTRNVTLGPRRWYQFNGILGATGQGYVQVRKVSGSNPFVAYGVINDGGRPGQRSGDGAFLLSRP